MNASLFRRWLNADLIVLSAVYGKRAHTVLSRPARNQLRTPAALERGYIGYSNSRRPRLLVPFFPGFRPESFFPSKRSR